jgi:hypothetical protein
LSPVAGDNTSAIQAALNAVGAMAADAHGLRGAVLLNPGTYEMDGTLSLASSGVVLRGAGPGTILNFVGATNATAVTVSGTGGASGTGTTLTFTDAYVPLNATTFHLNSVSGLAVGSTIIIHRPWTQSWITAMQMDSTYLGTEAWAPKTGPAFERTVTAINGLEVTIDIPLPTPIEQTWCVGTAQRYTDTGRIQNCGVENLTLLDSFSPNTGPLGLDFTNCKNCWAKSVVVDTFGNGIGVDGGGKWITVQDCTYQNGFNNGSARPSCFNIAGQMCLFQRCTAISGFEHIVTTQDSTAGPNVFLNIKAVAANSFDGGPHQKWALGVLMDSFGGPVVPLKIYNATTEGTGHGWVAGYSLEYNCAVTSRTCQQPPVAYHYNWIIGGSGTITSSVDPGTYQNTSGLVSPGSLYLEQLRERLGSSAVQNSGAARFAGNYQLVAKNSGLAVAVAGGATADGAAVVQEAFTGTTGNDVWQLVDVGGGYFEIKNLRSGKALGISAGVAVQEAYTAGMGMQWMVKDVAGMTCEVVNRGSGLALEVPGGSTASGVQFDQAAYIGGTNQQFQVVPLQ